MDVDWILREGESNVKHQGPLGEGGYGEVHKVRVLNVKTSLTCERWLISLQERYKAPSGFKIGDTIGPLTLICAQFFARKVIRWFGRVSRADIKNEIRAVQKLCRSSHPNVVQILEFGQLKRDSKFYFIDMDLCDFSLAQYIQCGVEVPGLVDWQIARQQPQNIFEITGQIIEGLIFIHKNEEVHRDLSPENGISSFVRSHDESAVFDGHGKMEDR